MFAIYVWLVTGFWLRLSTAINLFEVNNSQPLPQKKIVACTESHVFEIPVTVKPHFSSESYCHHPQCFSVQSRSAAQHAYVSLYMTQKRAGCSSAQQNRDVDDNLGERAKLSSKSSVGSFR